jgi:hypothetical protein
MYSFHVFDIIKYKIEETSSKSTAHVQLTQPFDKGGGTLRAKNGPLTEIDIFCLKLRNKAPQVVF